MRKAAGLMAAYGLLVVINAAAYLAWSGDASELPRAGIRLVGMGLVAWGLWRGAKWAWGVAVVLSGLFTLGGAAGLVMGIGAGLFAGRPYPLLDIGLLVAMIVTLGAAFFTLFSPRGRPGA